MRVDTQQVEITEGRADRVVAGTAAVDDSGLVERLLSDMWASFTSC